MCRLPLSLLASDWAYAVGVFSLHSFRALNLNSTSFTPQYFVTCRMIPARGFSSAEFFHCIETVLSYQIKKNMELRGTTQSILKSVFRPPKSENLDQGWGKFPSPKNSISPPKQQIQKMIFFAFFMCMHVFDLFFRRVISHVLINIRSCSYASTVPTSYVRQRVYIEQYALMRQHVPMLTAGY